MPYFFSWRFYILYRILLFFRCFLLLFFFFIGSIVKWILLHISLCLYPSQPLDYVIVVLMMMVANDGMASSKVQKISDPMNQQNVVLCQKCGLYRYSAFTKRFKNCSLLFAFVNVLNRNTIFFFGLSALRFYLKFQSRANSDNAIRGTIN